MNDSLDIKNICLQCSQDMLDQTVVLQHVAERNNEAIPGLVITDIRSIDSHLGFARLKLGARLYDTEGLIIRIDGTIPDEEVTFDNYDEDVPSINVYAPDKVLSNISKAGPAKVRLESNLKKLIQRTVSTYEEYGHKLSFPPFSPSFSDSDVSFPKNVKPTDDQIEAVRTVLNSSLSYVWGAPGTGKTQLVLATCITAYLMRGKRVLIVAPTNNAVEQVLRGVIKTIESNPEAKRYIDINKDIIRMGLATAGFFEDYPKICERKNTAAEVGKLKDEIQLIESLLKERSIEALRPMIDEIVNLIHKREEANFISKRGIERNLKSEIGKLKEKLSCYPEFQFLMDQTNEVNISSDIYRIRDRLYNRDVPVLSNQKYAKLSDSQLRDRIDKCNKEIKELKEYQSTARMGSSKIIGMTPHKLMQYSDKFFGDDPSIHIDHVFVDEAGYANMIQMLPVFMIGSPVTFLGDHKQLAPVFQLDKGDVKTWYNRKDSFMHYVSMWAMPAIYSEFALSGDFDKITKSYLNMKEPEFEITDTANLTASHRFGKNLASILDRCIYQNGITGHDGAPLEITIIDAPCEEEGEANLPEVNAIKDYILANKTRLKDFAVLTPYRAQVDALNNSLGKEYSNNIMTIHKSQGREWDTVIISVRDNEFTSKSVRLTFTSTVKNIDGARVINTAVSRAKKNLVIVCDIDFWTNRVDKNQLIRNLIIEAR